jgi:hypothetical protein
MNFIKLITALLCLIQIACASSGEIDSSPDINLIVSGKSAEGYIIGGQIETNDAINIISVPGNINDIVRIEAFHNLSFDSIIYKQARAILFIDNKTIIAIIGLKSERRITSDAVKLSDGIENFIENYGVSGLETFTVNNNKAYIYKDSGIALFDDNSDDTIDMYLIFRK